MQKLVEKFAGEGVRDQRPGFVNPKKGNKRAEPGSALLAKQDLIKGIEPGERYAGPFGRGALSGHVLVSRDLTGDII